MNDFPDKIIIKVIPHSRQRYDCLGDYFFKRPWYAPWKKVLHFRISEHADKRRMLGILIHEIPECLRTMWHGIKEEDIMAFDIAHDDCEDPGSLPNAPYRREHKQSEALEKILYEQDDTNWDYMEAQNPIGGR